MDACLETARRSARRRAAIAMAMIVALGSVVSMAGDLNPPAGPIVPTMKPLDQVEPRVVISTANTPGDADSLFRITQPGSYYLTGNVAGVAGKSGIEVAAADVTIDRIGDAVGLDLTASGRNA